jgi:hypothetical protein
LDSHWLFLLLGTLAVVGGIGLSANRFNAIRGNCLLPSLPKCGNGSAKLEGWQKIPQADVKTND